MPYLGLITLAVLILALVDIIRADEDAVHGIPKLGWIMLVVIIPIIGALLWIGFGRPADGDVQAAGPRGEFPEYEHPHRARATDPEADREFLRQVRARAEEQRRKARKQQQRAGEDPESES